MIDKLLVPSIPPSDDYVIRLSKVSRDDFNDEEYIDVSLYSPSQAKGFAMDMVPWESLTSMDVQLGEETQLTKPRILSEILWEITFWGYSPEAVEAEKDKLLDSIRDIEEGNCISFSSFEELEKYVSEHEE